MTSLQDISGKQNCKGMEVILVNGEIKINNTISSCILQAFTGIQFLLSIMGIMFALGFGGFSDLCSAVSEYKKGLLEYGIHFSILEISLKSDAMCLLLPVFSALPFTAAFLEYIECGYIKSYLSRAGRAHYIAGKIISVGISGGMVCAIAIGLYYNLLRLFMLPMEKCIVEGMTEMTYEKDVWKACVLFFCLGMLFSLIGMLFSILTSSKYMAYASPFVLEYALIILHERYLKKIYVINPKEWFYPTEELWMFGKLGVVIFLLLLVLFIVMLLIPVMLRRIDDI